jgi:hypothetical protein
MQRKRCSFALKKFLVEKMNSAQCWGKLNDKDVNYTADIRVYFTVLLLFP